MEKITVIGDTNSGKTCFLYAMYNFIAMGYVNGFTISASDVIVDKKFQDYFVKLKDSNLGKKRFPAPSNTKENFVFSLKYGFTEIASFCWSDYPGGYLKDNGEGSDDLVEDLYNSQAWVIFIDGDLLCEALGNADEGKKRKAVIKVCEKYNRFITKLTNEHKLPAVIPIIVTKSDIVINSGINGDEIITAIKTGLSSLFVDGCNALVSISLVSLGDNIAENDYRGELDPINIEYPITISVLAILNNMFEAMLNNVEDYIVRIDDDYDKFLTSSKAKREEWQGKIDELNIDLDKCHRMANAILNTLSDEKKMWMGEKELSMIKFYQDKFLHKTVAQ